MVESSVRESAPGRFYEFFAGGGMVRAGLGEGWQCLLANDLDPAKAAAYRANWGDAGLRVGDIAALTAADLPGVADLMWGSFPCQDLSLAGVGAGLGGRRSGTFHDFWALARDLAAVGIRVNTVAPGLINTPIYGEGEGSEQFKEKLQTGVLFPNRLGYGTELASMVVECVTNSYMNAETIRVDGGIRMPPK